MESQFEKLFDRLGQAEEKLTRKLRNLFTIGEPITPAERVERAAHLIAFANTAAKRLEGVATELRKAAEEAREVMQRFAEKNQLRIPNCPA